MSWYERLDADGVAAMIRDAESEGRASRAAQKRTRDAMAQAHTRDSLRAFRKLVDSEDGRLRFKAQPPLLVPLSDIGRFDSGGQADVAVVEQLLQSYTATLQHENHPIREFELVDMARKVVGVGSVGTRCWVLLLRGRDDGDPLILQAKEAQASVLERYLGPSTALQHGERVVLGQRLMQSGSDIFLGWQRVTGLDGLERDFYIRQLYDWKQSMDVVDMRPEGVLLYARACGETLARAHARTGDRVAIAAYLGGSDRFEVALEASARQYADQNEADYAAFQAAIASGRLATTELM